MKNNFYAVCIAVMLMSAVANTAKSQAPEINSISPQQAPVGSIVTLTGNNLADPTSVTMGSISELVISSENAKLVIMIMPGTTSGHITVTKNIYATTSLTSFNVLATYKPAKQLGGKLFSPTGAQQGYSVSMNANGTTAAIGDLSDSNQIGCVRVYTRTNNVWNQQGPKLAGTGGTGSSIFQGFSVALSADGNTLVEGGVGDNGFTGAIWIFTRDANGTWTQQGNKLVASNFINSQNTTPEIGYAVSISGDGNTVIVGGRRDNYYIGAAWIYTRNAGVWTEQQKLIGIGYSSYENVQGTQVYHGVEMGSAVSLSADGNTAAIGAPNDAADTGAVWIFTRSGNTFTQQGNKLVGTGVTPSLYGVIQQGLAVALNADGNTLIAGGPFDTDNININNNSNYGGAAWIFTRAGNIWSQQGNKLFATDAELGAEQGWSVSISADGNVAAVGAPGDSVYTGGFWLYTRSGNTWSQYSNKLLGKSFFGGPKEGWSTSISADGSTAIIGGPAESPNGGSWIYADSTALILPVTFENFHAYISGKGIQTTWAGFSEINISAYTIERSNNGYSFTPVASIPAKQNNALQNTYSWFDATPANGENFYRIKAINKDGSSQYSAIAKINMNTSQHGITVFPNPVANKQINLQLNNLTAGMYTISLYNTQGKMLYGKAFQHTGNNESLTIAIPNAAAGVYVLQVSGNNEKYHVTIMLQ